MFLRRKVVWGAVVCGVALMAGPVEAQWFPRDQGGWPENGQQVAYDRGYREGFQRGEDDARSGRAFAYERDRDYQRADSGYDRRYGNRDTYRRVFRDAYVVGYREGYNRYGGGRYGAGRSVPRGRGGYGGYGSGYPNGRGTYGRYGYADPAFDNGFADGYERGLDDARDGDRYDPLDHGRYRSADHGYNGRYGSKERYKNVYRDGFKTGYDQGYREGRAYGRDRGRRWPF